LQLLGFRRNVVGHYQPATIYLLIDAGHKVVDRRSAAVLHSCLARRKVLRGIERKHKGRPHVTQIRICWLEERFGSVLLKARVGM
jgi:hypothetical protein